MDGKEKEKFDLDALAVTILSQIVNGIEEHDGRDKKRKQKYEILTQLKKGRKIYLLQVKNCHLN